MANVATHKVGSSSSAGKKKFFGTDGIRGTAGSVLTADLAMRLGFFCANIFSSEGPIIIGQDSRLSGDMITAALTAGLTSHGKEVWQIGVCPTPAISYLIKKFKASGGFMITASHNPPKDNGIKIFDQNGTKIDNQKQYYLEQQLINHSHQVTSYISSNNFGKSYNRNQLLDKYIQGLTETIEVGKHLQDIPIILDLCWGSATSCGAKVFEAIGAKVKIINGNPDGRKINVNCGSTHIGTLREAVINQGAQMGFAFDGDADRMLAVDSKGRLIDGDHILYLLGSYLQDKNELYENRIVATVMSNLGFEKAWLSRGGLLERTAVGDQHVHKTMLEKKACLGGEQSGHILSTKNDLSGDGLLTALSLLEMCEDLSTNLTELFDQSFKPFPQKLVNINLPNCDENGTWEDHQFLKEALTKAEESIGKDGRILIRKSGTEPVLRIMVESHNRSMVDSLTSHIQKLAEENIKAA